jgi:anti-sigma regulatory factor (Ser/Thr protein kinase)
VAAWQFEAGRETPRQARRVVVDWARDHTTDHVVLGDIALAVTEAATNAVLHAFRDRAQPGNVIIEAIACGESLCVHVRDDGSGLIPRFDSPGLGLGLGLIAQLSAEADVHTHAEGGTEVVMKFHATA